MKQYEADTGFITSITGPMFSSKSEELIKRIEKMKLYGKMRVKAYKPIEDTRFSEDSIISRTGYKMPAKNIPKSLPIEVVNQILEETKDVMVVGFDEAQFFGKNIMPLVAELAYRKKHVLIDGLNLDYRGKEFGYIGGLLAMSNEVVMLNAYCSSCGSPLGTHTQRLVNGKPAKLGPIVLLGDKEAYEPRCRSCFIPPEKVNKNLSI